MPSTGSDPKRLMPRSWLLWSYIFFVVVYSCFKLLPKPNPSTLAEYGVTPLGLRLIYASLILLLALIWLAGYYGYARLERYARLIAKDKDGKAVSQISGGVFFLVMWLPVTSTVSSVLDYAASHNPSIATPVVLFENYLSMAIPFMGFILISLGARKLSVLTRHHASFAASNILSIFMILVGLVYFQLVSTMPDRQSIYHMSIWLILVTLATPYIYMWFSGLRAVYDTYAYQKKATGIVYRSSWSLLSFGLGWLIITSIGLQYLDTLVFYLREMTIYQILAIIYTLLIVVAIGFVLIADGTRKLERIEQV